MRRHRRGISSKYVKTEDCSDEDEGNSPPDFPFHDEPLPVCVRETLGENSQTTHPASTTCSTSGGLEQAAVLSPDPGTPDSNLDPYFNVLTHVEPLLPDDGVQACTASIQMSTDDPELQMQISEDLPPGPCTLVQESEAVAESVDEDDDNTSVISNNESIYEDSFSDFEDHHDQESYTLPAGEDPLYVGSEISLEMAMIAILTLVMSQRLSKDCVGHLLHLLKLLLPKDNLLVQSSHLFFSYFEKYLSSYKKHYYCAECSEALLHDNAVCPRCPGKKVNFFLQFSIFEQLQNLLSRPGFYEKLSYPQTRVKKNQNAYEDLYDGNIYKEAQENYFRFGDWISFMWNTDGFSIFKSSTFSVWPFYLSINELAPHLRLKKENMLLAGLYFGTGKFDPNLFLKPIYDELDKLRQGISFNIPSCLNPSVIIKSALLCGTADAPGKSSFFHHVQFNGLYGCMKCLCRGSKSQESGNVFVYPFEEQLTLRTEESLNEHLSFLKDTGAKVRFGVKGPSFLHKMLLLSSVRSTAIDIMHNVFLGVQKSLLNLWFNKTHRNADFSLLKCTRIMDEYLESLKPPHFLQRCPQPLSKLAFWKASEFQSFFFFYSLPILSIIMDPVYFNHYLMFYQGVFLLCKDSVSNEDIQLSQLLLDEFCKKFQELYGLRHMTFNLHCLRHLPDVVVELGPLWTSTCFLFEDLNGTLKHLVHGTQHIGLQVQSNFGLATRLSSLIKSCPPGELQFLCLQMYSPSKRFKVSFSIDSCTQIIGSLSKEFPLQPIFQQCISNFHGNISYFKRLRAKSTLFIVQSDCLGRKFSSCVSYTLNGVQCHGMLEVFFKLSQCDCTSPACSCPATFYAVLSRFLTTTPFKTLALQSIVDSVIQYTLSDIIDVIPILELKDVCFHVSFNDKLYIVARPNQQNMQ